MELRIRNFDELSNHELYEILKSRNMVFVAEQQCPYQDIDGFDEVSLHVFLWEDEKILAYLRAYQSDEKTVRIGRVLTMKRGCGLGLKVLKEGIKAIKERYDVSRIYLEAQTYATGFYEHEGFKICGEEFLEDDIPHIPMELVLGQVFE